MYAFRCYDIASLDTLPQCVSVCWELLRSEAFFLLLSNFTGLRLHYLCPADDDDDENKDEEKEKKEQGDREATGSSTESTVAAAAAHKSKDSGVHVLVRFFGSSDVCVCLF